MSKDDGNATLYHLNCGICGRTFWSHDASANVCTECKADEIKTEMDGANMVAISTTDTEKIIQALKCHMEKNCGEIECDKHGCTYCNDSKIYGSWCAFNLLFMDILEKLEKLKEMEKDGRQQK